MSIMFVKINVGHTVFDELKRVRGKVVSISSNNNKAKVKTENGTVSSNLPDLVIVNEEDMESMEKSKLEIKIKYFNNELTKIKKISQGDWIDLRASVDIELVAGEFKLVPLGVAMELPEGYEAVVAPRSSTFKNFGIIETNSIGVIDNSYSGNDDQWFFPAYALRDTVINFDERICQFRIQKRMPEINFTEVELLEGENRGGLGSTGVK